MTWCLQHFDSEEWLLILDGQGPDAGDVVMLAPIPLETQQALGLVASRLLTSSSLDAFLV